MTTPPGEQGYVHQVVSINVHIRFYIQTFGLAEILSTVPESYNVDVVACVDRPTGQCSQVN
jgi:hypothetical protein